MNLRCSVTVLIGRHVCGTGSSPTGGSGIRNLRCAGRGPGCTLRHAAFLPAVCRQRCGPWPGVPSAVCGVLRLCVAQYLPTAMPEHRRWCFARHTDRDPVSTAVFRFAFHGGFGTCIVRSGVQRRISLDSLSHLSCRLSQSFILEHLNFSHPQNISLSYLSCSIGSLSFSLSPALGRHLSGFSCMYVFLLNLSLSIFRPPSLSLSRPSLSLSLASSSLVNLSPSISRILPFTSISVSRLLSSSQPLPRSRPHTHIDIGGSFPGARAVVSWWSFDRSVALCSMCPHQVFVPSGEGVGVGIKKRNPTPWRQKNQPPPLPVYIDLPPSIFTLPGVPQT